MSHTTEDILRAVISTEPTRIRAFVNQAITDVQQRLGAAVHRETANTPAIVHHLRRRLNLLEEGRAMLDHMEDIKRTTAFSSLEEGLAYMLSAEDRGAPILPSLEPELRRLFGEEPPCDAS